MFVTGILTTKDMGLLQKVLGIWRKLRTGKRYIDVPNTDKKIGEEVLQGSSFKARIGGMAFWDRELIAVPYACSFGSELSQIIHKFKRLYRNAEEFDAPIFYMFDHLRKTGPEKKEERKGTMGIEVRIGKFERFLRWLSEKKRI